MTGRLGWVRDVKFGRNISNKKLLNAAKPQGCSFYSFWIIKSKLTGGKNSPPPPRLWLTDSYISCDEFILVNNVLKENDMKE